MSDFTFCPRCGHALGHAHVDPQVERSPASALGEPVSDRRTVTVLFADLSGFTALSERLDPEEVRAFQNRLFAMLSAAVEQYDGFVEKYVGDAVMAVFGAPVAHEDDPERALRAALVMCERTDALVEQGRSLRLSQPLRLHVGVHCGPVVTGMLGPDKHSAYAVTGDTVNIASRLQSAAAPGEILVSAAVQRCGQHAFAFEPHEPLLLKGKSEKLAVYSLGNLLPRPAGQRGLETIGLSAPLVGREEELEQLLAAFERARRGRTQVVSLIGEAGLGKSRLLTECLARLQSDGDAARITVRRVYCSPLQAQSYGVVASFVRDAYGIAPDDVLQVARAKLASGVRALGADLEQISLLEPMLGYILGLDAIAPDSMQPERLRRQIFSATGALVEQRLQVGPLVLAIEDLQWADAASVELLGHLVDRLPDRTLMVVFTYRPGSHLPALGAVRTAHTGIPLTQLSPQDVEGMLAALFGAAVREWPADLRALVVSRASGNPLYLEEIVRSMIAGGRLVQTQRGWVCAVASEGVEIPQTLQGLILSRLDRAAPPVRRLLEEAAVLGPIFDAALLKRVTSAPAALDANLEASIQAQLVEEISKPHESARRFRFAHTLLHEVTYESLLLSRRTELHGVVAQSLERTVCEGPRRLEDVVALAHHFGLSPDRRKAAEYLVEAGDWAASIYANVDAVRHYERALVALRDCEACAAEILGVRERLGDLFGPMGRRDAAKTHYAAVQAGWEQLGYRANVARLLRKIGGLDWEAGEREQALKCFHAGLDLLAGEPDVIERAHLYQELGRCAFRSGDHNAAMEFAERALAEAERLIELRPHERREAAAAASHARNTLGIALARMQRLGEAVDHIERSVAMAEANDLPQAAGRGYTNLGVLYAVLDAKRGVAACERGLEIAKKIGDFALQSGLYANLAVAYCALTDRCEEQGMQAARASIQLDRELDQLDHLAVPLIVLGQIYQCHGEPHRARECYNEALALAEKAGEPQLLFPCYDGLATLHLDLGEEEAAEGLLTQAEAVCQRHGIDPDHLTVLPFLT